jgi:hypothetical protein
MVPDAPIAEIRAVVAELLEAKPDFDPVEMDNDFLMFVAMAWR